MTSQYRTESSSKTIRIGGKLKEIITIKDTQGNILQKIISPLMVEVYPRDIMQVMVGSTLIAIPLCYTEEVWNLGSNLPLWNIIAILFLSILFISLFVYYNFYREHFITHKNEFIKRVLVVYILSFIMVGVVLLLIQKAPWTTDAMLAFKRNVIVAFPASLSAAVADMIK